jgi:metallophosphoesterase (TIGR00282 family)
MKLFYAAEIVGKGGIGAFKRGIERIRASRGLDFCIAGANGATGGAGLGRQHAGYLRKLGADCLTLGDYCFLKKDLTEDLGKLRYILRPYNMVASSPGYGQHIFQAKDGTKVACAVLLGQAGFSRMHGENPYEKAAELVDRLKRETPFVIVDFHAQASAEKRTLFFQLAGKCTAVIGSHTRVQTADEEICDGTAYITDAGRTGVVNAPGGLNPEPVVSSYLTGVGEWTREADSSTAGGEELQGVFIETDSRGRAESIERIKLAV